MKIKQLIQRKAGFTLVELSVVIAILSILAGIAVMKISSANEQAKTNTCLYNRGVAERAYSVYLANGGTAIQENTTGTSSLVEAGLLGNGLICKSGGTYTWKKNASGELHLNCSIHGEVTGATMYQSTFVDMNGLISLMGKWSVQDGSLKSTPGAESRAVFNGTQAADYDITANAQLISGQGYGIYYRATNDPNISGYVFQFDPGYNNQFIVRKVINGVQQAPFQRVNMTSVMGNSFDINGTHAITISAQGANQVIKVDGKQVLSFSDTTFTSGYVGARTWGSSQLQLQDINVATK